jgi:signal transduction histidine kinase
MARIARYAVGEERVMRTRVSVPVTPWRRGQVPWRRPKRPAPVAGLGQLPDEVDPALLRELLGNLDMIVFVADPTLRQVRFISEQARKLGFPLAAFRAAGFWEGRLNSAEERTIWGTMQTAAMRDGSSQPMGLGFRRADGSLAWYRVQLRRLDLPDGPGLIGMMQDQSGRVRAGAAMGGEAEDPRTRLILEQLPAIVTTTDRDLVYTSVTGGGLAASVWKDIPEGAASVYTLYQTRDPDHPIVRDFRRALAGETVTHETAWAGRWYRTTIEPFRDRAGEVIGTLAISLDITDRILAERERAQLLARAQELATLAQTQAAELGAILDRVPEPVLVFRADGTLTVQNRAAMRLGSGETGIRPGMSLQQLFDAAEPRDLDGRPIPMAELPVTRALAGQVVTEQRLVYHLGGNDVILAVSTAAIRADDGAVTAVVAVYRDVTAQEAFDRLRLQFVRAAAHELKTPVAILKGFTQLAGRQLTEASGVEPATVAAIERGVSRISRIVDHLVLASALVVGSLELRFSPVSVPAVLARVLSRLPAGADQVGISGDALTVQADAERVTEVFYALVDNALKFSPAGEPVRVTLSHAGGQGLVTVADRGIGIPADRLEHLFDPFYRAHAETAYDYGGMGIGLFLARELVTRMGGRIWFESRPGRGSTFTVALPLATEAPDGGR